MIGVQGDKIIETGISDAIQKETKPCTDKIQLMHQLLTKR